MKDIDDKVEQLRQSLRKNDEMAGMSAAMGVLAIFLKDNRRIAEAMEKHNRILEMQTLNKK